MASAPVLLELDLTRGLLDAAPEQPLEALRAQGVPVLPQAIERLRRAAQSDAVGGLIARIGDAPGSPAQAAELGAAVEAFAATGKPAICFSEAFGEVGSGTLGYHLATYFDEIWLQPSGALGLVGFGSESLFARGALDKLGVEPQFGQRHEYKNAPDVFLRSDMSDAQREATERLVTSLTDELVRTLARRRDLTEAEVRDAMAASPLPPHEAAERGLVDHVGYRDAAYLSVRRRIAGEAHRETPEADLPDVELRYLHRWSEPLSERLRTDVVRDVRRHIHRALGRTVTPGTIAVVDVNGPIVLGRGSGSPLGGSQATSDRITAALRLAGRSDDVAAVVLRVVSPGGSATASDSIHHEVARLRDAGTPVVASMGTVAASGGYFVAMGCDEILALPGTITGSIGVLAGKFVVSEAMDRAGLATEAIATGSRATMWSPTRRFDEDELRWLDRWLDEVYEDFVTKAAAGRDMPVAELEPLARGRVWTGADALERGLVDRIGGLGEAVTRAAELAGLTRDRVKPTRWPDIPPIARLLPASSSESPTAAASLSLPGSGLLSAAERLRTEGPEGLLAELAAGIGLPGAGAMRLMPGSLPR